MPLRWDLRQMQPEPGLSASPFIAEDDHEFYHQLALGTFWVEFRQAISWLPIK